eukprot:TRINITY_DN24289_c0_g1_i1.p1 TRINITY_DN24289_c0_g1~~TRINITY_DN24289_c0_g1_i1.p1  ORF type:complete len:638 (+),score=164.14 TRINITY_DN24289_c0_g1_i1:43-1956(+)
MRHWCVLVGATVLAAASAASGGRTDYDVIVVGAGPAGIQLSYSLSSRGFDFVVLERASKAGTFFERQPVHRKLISINKRYTGSNDPEYRLRHDWNSLLGAPTARRFTNYTTDMFAHADVLLRYFNDFVADHGLADSFRFNTDVRRIAKVAGRFAISTSKGEYSSNVVIVATGRAVPHIDKSTVGWELLTDYQNVSVAPGSYAGEAVAIVGSGNAAMETADGLEESAALVHILARSNPRMAHQTHYVGDIRMVNARFIDRYLLKSEEAFFGIGGGDEPEAELEAMDVTPEAVMAADHGGAGWSHRFTKLPDGRIKATVYLGDTPVDVASLRRPYDRVIRCTGWRPDWSIYDVSATPDTTADSRFPRVTTAYESVNVAGMYFAGALAHGRDYRKSSGGFIHGFRYIAAALPNVLSLRRGQEWPRQGLDCTVESLAATLQHRMGSASSMYQMFAFFGDVAVIEPGCGVGYMADVPLELLTSGVVSLLPTDRDVEYVTLSFEWHPLFNGRGTLWHRKASAAEAEAETEADEGLQSGGEDEAFAGAHSGAYGRSPPAKGSESFPMSLAAEHDGASNFLHPVLRLWRRRRRRLRAPQLLSTHHVHEDVHTTFDHDRSMTQPLQRWLRQQVAGALRCGEGTCGR